MVEVERKQKTVENRIVKSLLIFLILSIAFGVRLLYLDVIKGEEFKRRAEAQWQSVGRRVPGKRGTIYDRNGRILAISIKRYRVVTNPSQIDDKERWLERVSDKLGIEKETLRNKINTNSSYLVLKTGIDKEEKERIEKLNIKYLYFEPYYERFYPMHNLASYIIGEMGIDRGLEGLEYKFDSILRGEYGTIGFLKDALGREIPGTEFYIKKPRNGADIYLTIDINIQAIMEFEMRKTIEKYKPKRVITILEDIKTGEIIGMATLPNFDPNDFSQFSKAKFPDPAYGWNYEPGSSFKPLVTSAAIEEGVLSEEDKFECKGYIYKGGKRFTCIVPHGTQTIKDLLRNSCNVGFIQVGSLLGDKLYHYLKLFGVGDEMNLDFPYEGKGDILPPEKWSATTLPTMSFGVGITVTPLQQTSFYQAIANKGNRLKPQIIKRIVKDGKVIKEAKPSLIKKVISETTANKVLSYLKYVVGRNGVRRAVITGYSIGGKTGTAGVIENGKYVEGKTVLWFVGIITTKNPRYVLTVLVDEPEDSSLYASQVAAPLFKRIAERVIKYFEIEPDEKVK